MQTFRSVVTLARDRHVTFLAAGITYYASVSIIPLALLAVAVTTAVGGEALTNRVVRLVNDVLSRSGQELVVSTLTATAGRGTASVVGLLAPVAVITVALLPVYYVLPPVDVALWSALPGAVVAAGGWVLLQLGFRVYAANAGQYAAYGLIGAVLLFVTWLYFASIVVLLGAVVNAVLAEAAAAPA